jgi:hypothetical protein
MGGFDLVYPRYRRAIPCGRLAHEQAQDLALQCSHISRILVINCDNLTGNLGTKKGRQASPFLRKNL